MSRQRCAFAWALSLAVLLSSPAAAQEKKAGGDLLEPEVDVKDVVVEAMKSTTTVQEAPAIVTVVTADEIDAMGYRLLSDIVGQVPGFIENQDWYGAQPTAYPRGVVNGALTLQDGIDTTDMGARLAFYGPWIPVETIRRIELTSGPGGVLWGSNSFLGVVNIVSKTADDLDGVAASAGYGTGPGRQDAFKGYVMAGQKLFKDRLKVFLHVGYDTWRDAEMTLPASQVLRYASPMPQGPTIFALDVTTDPDRSHVVVFDGNVQYGPLALYWSVPWTVINNRTNGFGLASRRSLPEDALDCSNPNNKDACALRVDPDRTGRTSAFDEAARYVMLKASHEAFARKLHLEGRAFYFESHTEFRNLVASPASSILLGGLPLRTNYWNWRAGGTADASLVLPWNIQLLGGGEIYWDQKPENIGSVETYEATAARTTLRCARTPDGRLVVDSDGRLCAFPVIYESDRLTGGLFLSAQSRIRENLIVDAGARVQLYGGKRSLDPTFLVSGAAVWGFLPDWYAKVNYSEGFRPPSLMATDGNGLGINYAGNPELETEKSRSIMGEINTRLLQGRGPVQVLGLRADYSYTWLDNFIRIEGGKWSNADDIGIHSVELLADLRLKQGHWFGLGYTFLDIANSSLGKDRSAAPNQWFVVRGLVNLWNRQLYLSTNLTVSGSAEDPNYIPTLDTAPNYIGEMENGEPVMTPMKIARATDLVHDRIPPAAIWNAGLRFRLPRQHLDFFADVYNLLNSNGAYPDPEYELSAYTAASPNLRPGISFFLRGQYTY